MVTVEKIAHDPHKLSAPVANWASEFFGGLPPVPEMRHLRLAQSVLNFRRMGLRHGYKVLLDERRLELRGQIRMLPSAEDIEAIVSEVDPGYLRGFATAIMTVAADEARRECMGLEAVSQLNGWFATMEELVAAGVDHAQADDHLAAALKSLDSVQAEAEEEGEQIPSDSVIAKARVALLRIHSVAQRTYDISGMPDGGVVIQVETPFGASFVLIVEADAGAHCLMAIGSSKVEQRKYTDEEMRELPDAFMKDALARLPRI